MFVVGGNFAELEAADPAPIVDRRADDLAALLYTGGTTGRSKGVALSHANLSHAGASSRAVSHVPGLDPRHQRAAAVALVRPAGDGRQPARSGAARSRSCSAGSSRPSGCGWPPSTRAQTTAVVPSMLAILLGQPLEDYDLSALRFVYSGAAPLSAAVAAEFARRVPSATVLEGYGCTETGGIISGTPPLAPRPGTVGRAVPGVTIRIVDPDGADVPAGDDGEIVVRGPNVMAATGAASRWPTAGSRTGDVGRLDADGYLTIVDRIKDLILRGGFNVYPRDVEDALMTHPAVAMAAVVGRPDERLGEEVVAFVSLAAGATSSRRTLIDYARERLGAHKYPREVHIVDEIPLTSVGKLDRKRLRMRDGRLAQ